MLGVSHFTISSWRIGVKGIGVSVESSFNLGLYRRETTPHIGHCVIGSTRVELLDRPLDDTTLQSTDGYVWGG